MDAWQRWNPAIAHGLHGFVIICLTFVIILLCGLMLEVRVRSVTVMCRDSFVIPVLYKSSTYLWPANILCSLLFIDDGR